MDAPFEALEAQIEGLWREILGNDLKLYPLKAVRRPVAEPTTQLLHVYLRFYCCA